MKKLLASAVIGLSFCAVSTVSAECHGTFPTCSELDRSVGGGVLFAGDFGGGLYSLSRVVNQKTESETTPWYGGGIHLFFDASYAEAAFDLISGSGDLPSPNYLIGNIGKTEISFVGLGISMLLKYPFELADNFSLFPAAGIDYVFVFSVQIKQGSEVRELIEPKPNNFGALWFKFGGGFDLGLTGAVFIRPELLYGFRLASKVEKDLCGLFDGDDVKPASVLGHGLTVKVGVGYKI